MNHEPLVKEVQPEHERHDDAKLQSVIELIWGEEDETRLHDDAYEANPEVELEHFSLVILAHWEQHEYEVHSRSYGDEPDDEHNWVFGICIYQSDRVAYPSQEETSIIDVDSNESFLFATLEAALLRWFNSHSVFSKFTLIIIALLIGITPSSKLNLNKMRTINLLPRLTTPSPNLALPLLFFLLIHLVNSDSPCTPINVTF